MRTKTVKNVFDQQGPQNNYQNYLKSKPKGVDSFGFF